MRRLLSPDPVFREVTHRYLGSVAAFLATLFCVFVALGLIDRSAGDAWWWIVGTDAATLVTYVLVFIALRSWRLPGWLTYPTALFLASLPAANALLAYHLTGNLFFLTYLTMVPIGAGAYMLSLPWLWLGAAALSGATWVVATWTIPPGQAAQYAPLMVGSIIVGSMVLVIRRMHIIDFQRTLIALQVEAEERKRAEARLAHAQRLESIGKLVSGIAHDFNNLLMVILGYTESAIDNQSDPELREDLEIVLGAGQSAASLAGKLLAFGRQQVMQPKVVDVNDLVRDARALVSKSVPHNVQLLLELDAWAGTVKVDPVQIEQVLINLAINARDAMPDGGSITLRTRSEPVGEDYASSWVVIEVCDTGSGMPPEVIARAFEPFFTTKEAGRGTGLGLSMVHGIVVQSGGSIELDSKPGAGTRVVLKLPQESRLAAHDGGVEAAAPRPVLGALTVLVVDDEPQVRTLVARMLEAEGCQVVQAPDASRALELVDTRTFDVIVSDVVMPGMSGVELVNTLRRQGHTEPMLLMSGHAADKVAESGGMGAPLIHKPFTADELLRSLAGLVRLSASTTTATA